MDIIMHLIKSITYIAPFVLLCMATRKVNLSKSDRGYQFLMPAVALLYCIVAVLFLNTISNGFIMLLKLLGAYIPFLAAIDWTKYITYIANTGLISVFLIVKMIVLPILKRVWSSHRTLMEKTGGLCYEYEEDIDKWLLKKEFGQVKYYYSAIFYCALVVSTVIFTLSQAFSHWKIFDAKFYPVFGVIVLGEVINFLSGITKSEFVEDILGEDEEAYKIANYGLLRGVLRDLFEDRVLYDVTLDNGLDKTSAFDTLDEMCKSENPTISSLGKYYMALKESGKDIDSSYVKSCVNLIQGQSTLFCNPFYRDLTDYIMFPMIRQLMRYRKCLIVMGRDSATDDVKTWIEEGIFEQIHTESLWKVEVLTKDVTEADIGIMKFCDLYNLEIQKNNQEFLERVGFVFIIEPSRLLATGQMGLSLLVNRFDESREKVVYGACDRNCDGLVDALSHTLKTNITEVTATVQSGATTSLMCWEADGEYMHHKIFSNVSRYLGVGTVINAVAMKYQIANTVWISSEKFPVLDMKWVAGQYYKKLCNYTNLPVSQDAFNKAFHVESNLWDMRPRDNAFMVVEDEFQNLFELTRLFSTRALQQGFINVISENYLLREYMIDNVDTFVVDPKAIPTIVPDYSRTERNTVLKLIMRMTEEQISEDDLIKTLEISGIDFTDPLEILKSLIRKHCYVDEINIRVYFREKLMEDALRSEVKKYYAIEGDTEIAKYAQNFRNAYYLAEDEKGEIYHIGAKLYGHVFQALMPGQFLTYAGKYYEVQSITPQNGVVVRRAADHINGRKYYRQIRFVSITDWKDDENVGGQKTISDIRLEKGYCQIQVHTDGYLEMQSYNDLKTAKHVHVSGVPTRNYRNKLVLKVVLPGASENIRYTICLLLNEIFKTTYPDSYHYVSALTPVEKTDDMSEKLRFAMHTMGTDSDQNAIYIVEDSEIDLGLIASVERNIERYFEIITEVLAWHEVKMTEKPVTETEDYGIEFGPQEEVPVVEEPVGFWARFLAFLKKLLAKLKKPKKEKEPVPVEEAKPVEEPVEEPEAAEEPVEEPVEEAVKKSEEAKEDSAEETEFVIEGDEPVKMNDEGSDDTPKIFANMAPAEEKADAELSEEDSEAEPAEPTEYQKNCFLKYGYEDFEDFLDFKGTSSYLTAYGYDKNPLSQVRDKAKEAEQYQKVYDPYKAGAHYCDFCGVELTGGEYELLKDGRERCNQCSATALQTGEEFKEVFKKVMRNMEIFYGIKFNVAIRVRMTDAKKIAKHLGEEFVATPGFDGRTLGFAQKDSSGYSIYVESGSPKLAAIATIAHELTHIWQYQNWDDRAIVQKYGAHKRLEIYEGMAKWAEIQYLMCINELAYAKRQEIITQFRDDPYGRGFVRYRANYPLTRGAVLTGPTPFKNTSEPLDPAYTGEIRGIEQKAPAQGTPSRSKKSSGKKVRGFLLLLLLIILGIIFFRPKADEDVPVDNEIVTEEDMTEEEETEEETEEEVQEEPVADTEYYAYNKLNADEQKLYTAAYKAIQNFEPGLTEMPVTMQEDRVGRVMASIELDHPEIFWFQNGSEWQYDVTTKNTTGIKFVYCMTQEEAKKRQQEIDAVLQGFYSKIDSGMSEYDIALTIYDMIIQHADYDSVALDAEDKSKLSREIPDDLRNIYGHLVNKKSVCAGYASVMQLMLQHYGIECVNVASDTHEWNLAKLEGDYYYIDATWGDHSNTLAEKNTSPDTDYDYFCITTAELNGLDEHKIVTDLTLPECTAVKCNYYRRENLYVEAYNYEQIQEIALNTVKNNQKRVSFKCASNDVYKQCLKELVNNYKFPEIIKYVNQETGNNFDTQYTYWQNETFKTLGFDLK